MVILAVALQLSSLVGLIAAAVVAGIGQGISFSRGLAAVAERTPADRRAEVSSTYFVVAYVAISLPVVGEGLAAQHWGLQTAGVTFAVAVAILSAICLVAILVLEARQSRSQSPSDRYDRNRLTYGAKRARRSSSLSPNISHDVTTRPSRPRWWPAR